MSRWTKVKTLSSQFLNVMIFNGNPDEAISGRSYREGELGGDPKWKRIAKIINWTSRNPNHCKGSHQLDIEFARVILGSKLE